MEKVGFFATGKILLFLSLKTLDSDPPLLIHNLSFNNNYQNDLEFLITMSSGSGPKIFVNSLPLSIIGSAP
jgi:hypothetical protein